MWTLCVRGCGTLNKAFLYSNCYQVIEVKLVLLGTNKQTNKVILKVEWAAAQREWEWAQTATASRVKLGKHCGVALMLSTSVPSGKVAQMVLSQKAVRHSEVFMASPTLTHANQMHKAGTPHPLSSDAELSWCGVSALLSKKSIRVHGELQEYSLVSPLPLVYLKQSLFINESCYSCPMQ